eukprot:959547-Heterocapsa_arctica.AAC.1
MEHDLDGSGLAHFIDETGNINERGDAAQSAVFARIHKIQVEVHAYGMDMQVFYGGELGRKQTVIILLLSNYNKWGNPPNHYDFLYPHEEVGRAQSRIN